jgi:hypothetical protein
VEEGRASGLKAAKDCLIHLFGSSVFGDYNKDWLNHLLGSSVFGDFNKDWLIHLLGSSVFGDFKATCTVVHHSVTCRAMRDAWRGNCRGLVA